MSYKTRNNLFKMKNKYSKKYKNIKQTKHTTKKNKNLKFKKTKKNKGGAGETMAAYFQKYRDSENVSKREKLRETERKKMLEQRKRRLLEREIKIKEMISDEKQRLSSERRRKSLENKIRAREKSSDDKQRKRDKYTKAFLNDECTICLDDLDDDKNKTKIEKCLGCLDTKNKKLYFTGCEHTFHGRCLDKWLKENRDCPLCRSNIHELSLVSYN